ncbi:hypothetical protein [Borealpox virus]|nr:hypothetical protein [Alaskapox virus]
MSYFHLRKSSFCCNIQEEAYRYSLSSDLSCFDSIDLDIDLIET